jgi:hypothetical protein
MRSSSYTESNGGIFVVIAFNEVDEFHFNILRTYSSLLFMPGFHLVVTVVNISKYPMFLNVVITLQY